MVLLWLQYIIFKETTKEANTLDKARNMNEANYLFDQETNIQEKSFPDLHDGDNLLFDSCEFLL